MLTDPESLRIAVVDSGVTATHPHLQGVVVGGFAVDGSGAITPDYRDHHGHGTAVAAVIFDGGGRGELLAVRVLDPNLRCGHEALARGIVHAADRGARLINVSMGTRALDAAEGLRDAVRRAARAGAVVVAAAPPTGAAWPADLDGVIGVESDPDCPAGCHRAIVRPLHLPDGRDCDVQRFVTRGQARSADGLTDNFTGNSLAAAHMTAIAARSMAADPTLDPEGLVRRLERDGIRRSA